MAKIWANRLIANDKIWADVPDTRKDSVKTELRRRVEYNEITAIRYKEITGEDY